VEKLFAWRRFDSVFVVSSCIRSKTNTDILKMISCAANELVTWTKASSKEVETLEKELKFDGLVSGGNWLANIIFRK